MAFNLASAFVELSAKGVGGVITAVDSVKNKLNDLSKAPIGVLGEKADAVAGHFSSMLNPINLVASALAALGAGAGVGSMLSIAGAVEKSRIQFDQLTRSATVTDDLLKTLKKQFVGSGISSEEYKAVARELLAMGVAASDVPARLKVLGNISAATGDSLEGMARAMRRAELTGRITSRTLMMMPAVVEELNRMYPQLGGKIMEAADEGQIGIAQLNQAIESLGGETGRYSNALAAGQAGMAGQWAILSDKVTVILGGFGSKIYEAFNLDAVMNNVTAFASNFEANYGGTILQVLTTIGDVASTVWGWISSFTERLIADGTQLWSTYGSMVMDVFNFIGTCANVVFAFIGENQWVISLLEGIAGAFVAIKIGGMAVSMVIGTLSAIFGPFIMIIRMVIGIGGMLVGVIRMIGTAMTFLAANPVILIIGAVLMLTLCVWSLWAAFTGGEGPMDFLQRKVGELTKSLGINLDATKKAAGIKTTPDALDMQLPATPKLPEMKVPVKPVLKHGTGWRDDLIKGNPLQKPAIPLGPGTNAKHEAPAFTSLTGLAEKMQQEAGKQDMDRQKLAAQQQGNGHLGALAGAAGGGGLRVQVVGAQPAQF